jgi:hypothetical protein
MERIGTLVLVVHDAADFWLELAKMANYAKYEAICNVFFTIFTLKWFVTRLVGFPTRILYSTTFEGPQFVGYYPVYQFLNVLLFVLQIMHILWFKTICKIAYKSFIKGDDARDDRSEDSGDSGEEQKENTTKTNTKNKKKK